jgi:hypothetical protein
MTVPDHHRASWIEIVDHQFAVEVAWVQVSIGCGCVNRVSLWSATIREDQRPSESEAARWSAVLAGALGLDSPLAICDRRRPFQ